MIDRLGAKWAKIILISRLSLKKQLCPLLSGFSKPYSTRLSIAQITDRVSYGRGWYCRQIIIHGCSCALQLNAEFWARERYTPIWLSIWDQQRKTTQEVKDALSPLQYRDPPQLVFVGENVVVPLRPALGVEEDEVIRDLVQQIQEVADLLKEYGLETRDASNKQSSVTENELPESALQQLYLEKQ